MTGAAEAGAPGRSRPTWTVVAALGAAQTLAYASSYYIPAILAPAVARDLGLPPWSLFAGLSGALVVGGLMGPWVGRLVDRTGGRGVLLASGLALAGGLALLAAARGPLGLALAWLVLGAAMGLGFYDVAFAYLAGLYGRAARAPITGVTLVAGFASTVGWPATAWMEARLGWRGACLAWAALDLALVPALYLSLPRPPAATDAHPGPIPGSGEGTAISARAPPPAPRRQPRGFWTLAFVFAAVGLCNSGMAAHLPGVLAAAGASPSAAVAAAALVGPAQVAARLAEFGLMRRAHPLLSARLGTLAHPLGAAALAAFGPVAAPAFALLHGGGNGVLTIAKGALPLALFGPAGYGARQGVLSLPASFAFAAAPLLFGLLLERLGTGVLAISGGVALAATVALFALRPAAAPAAGLHATAAPHPPGPSR